MGEKCVDTSFVSFRDLAVKVGRSAFQVVRSGHSGWLGARPPPTLFWRPNAGTRESTRSPGFARRRLAKPRGTGVGTPNYRTPKRIRRGASPERMGYKLRLASSTKYMVLQPGQLRYQA